jgi:hypothetical protein
MLENTNGAEVEAHRARTWREAMKLSRDELSVLNGYSIESIYLFERGTTAGGKPHAPDVWKRYKLACMAVRFLLHFKMDGIDDWQWT